jgi:hypothetical protein
MIAARSPADAFVLSTTTDCPAASASSIRWRWRRAGRRLLRKRSLLTRVCVAANRCAYKVVLPAPWRPMSTMTSGMANLENKKAAVVSQGGLAWIRLLLDRA